MPPSDGPVEEKVCDIPARDQEEQAGSGKHQQYGSFQWSGFLFPPIRQPSAKLHLQLWRPTRIRRKLREDLGGFALSVGDRYPPLQLPQDFKVGAGRFRYSCPGERSPQVPTVRLSA